MSLWTSPHRWRSALLILAACVPLAVLLAFPPIAQPQDYYRFADRRAPFGIPNFFDVTTNLAFLLVGLAGLRVCVQRPPGQLRAAWLAFFAGLTFVSLGSAFFHWEPNDDTLVWDRLPMTIAFLGLVVAVTGETVNPRLGKRLLVPALCVGLASVGYWHWSGDLRPYIWVQAVPLLVIPLALLLFPKPYSHASLLGFALAAYLAAKLVEYFDREIFECAGRFLSGHSLKHLLAALACYLIVLMLRRRTAVLAVL